MTTQFLHKKKDSSLWYYRRRFPQDVARVVGKSVHMQSLQTSVRRDAEIKSRKVSVEFDSICQDARTACDALLNPGNANSSVEELRRANAQTLLAAVPSYIRLAALRVIEEQQQNPYGWREEVSWWRSRYQDMVNGMVPSEIQMPAIQAQAYLNGIDMAVQGQPLPPDPVAQSNPIERPIAVQSRNESNEETWTELCDRALREYRHKVGESRYKLAVSKLPEVTVAGCTELDIQDGLRVWCNARLLVVQPRSVKGQLDCMVSALRCVLPKLTAPVLRELQGVMQPRVGDRQSMPIQDIRAALQAFKSRPVPVKVRNDYGGGASQFDAIAVEVLAVLGMRPRELIQARPIDLVTKTDVFGEEGLYLRLVDGKNKASEREIPLSDGTREAVPVQRLREMLEWQEKNPRSIAGAVTSLGTRFNAMTSGYTLYQMRHSWKDLAVHAGVDSELRERLMGHKVPGVAAAYGSGIPLEKGLDALMLVRRAIGI